MTNLVERLRKQDCKTLLDAYDIMEAGSEWMNHDYKRRSKKDLRIQVN